MLSEEINQDIGPDTERICCPQKEEIETDSPSQREGCLFNFNYYYFLHYGAESICMFGTGAVGWRVLVSCGRLEVYCFEPGGGRAFWGHFSTGLSRTGPLSFP